MYTIKFVKAICSFLQKGWHNFNFYGTRTLGLREIKRFMKVYHQAIIAPAISSMLFWSVFVLALGGNKKVHGVEFGEFIGCGLIIMSIIQNSFANSSSSIILSKVIGYVIDILIPPFNGLELTLAYLAGSVVRGVLVGLVVSFVLSFFIKFQIYHFWLMIFFSLSACVLLGLFGIIVGVYTDNFDKSSAITNYIIVPLSFLSGTFYSIDRLPPFLQTISHCNPFFYLIDGFRYSLTDFSNSNIFVGTIFLSSLNVSLFIVSVVILNNGWRLKS